MFTKALDIKNDVIKADFRDYLQGVWTLSDKSNFDIMARKNVQKPRV